MSNTKLLAVRQIDDRDQLDDIFGFRWQVVHEPTGCFVATFRLKRTAQAVAKWLAANVPADLLASTDGEAIGRVAVAAGFSKVTAQARRDEARR